MSLSNRHRTGPLCFRMLGCAFGLALLLPAMSASADEDSTLRALIEIPVGSFTKYEIDPESGDLVVDRFLSMPVGYPANYGGLPATLGEDGDLLDVLVLSREPILPKAYIHVRAVGMLVMEDGGEADSKIIAVPASSVDPYYDEIRDITDLPAAQRAEISAFFEVYKKLPPGKKKVVLDGFRGRAEAEALITAALQRAAAVGTAPTSDIKTAP